MSQYSSPILFPAFLFACLHKNSAVHHPKSLKCKPDVAKRSRPEEVFHSYKNTCPLQPYAIKITSPLFSSCINCGHFVRVSLDRELDIHDTHAFTNTHKRRKMRSRERRSLKFQGDIGEERGASGRSSRGAGLPGNWPHQYENEPGVTVAAVR